jgi:hypothetical protein
MRRIVRTGMPIASSGASQSEPYWACRAANVGPPLVAASRLQAALITLEKTGLKSGCRQKCRPHICQLVCSIPLVLRLGTNPTGIFATTFCVLMSITTVASSPAVAT